MTWRSNNNRDRTVIDGITWLPRGPSSDSSCVEELYGNKGPTGPTGPGFPEINGPITNGGSIGPLTGSGTFTLPVSPYTITSVTFVLVGGAGGPAGDGSIGYGGKVTTTISNPTVSTVYNYSVGLDSGGGAGGTGSTRNGSNGGALSSIYIGATAFMIAGGGGGGSNNGTGGYGCYNNTPAGGNARGGSIASDFYVGLGGSNGTGGKGSTSGGGADGGSINGGAGGSLSSPNCGGGGGGNGDGGGGGGGGDSGGLNRGGGAGGSYVNRALPNTMTTYTPASASGSLTITWNYSSYPVLQYDVSDKTVFYGVKTFVIEHPLNINKYLVHACLEGPEAGVYYRGTAIINSDCRSVDIYLDNYVEHIANDFTIYVTPMLMENEGISFPSGISFPKLITSPIVNGKFTVYSDIIPCKFNYIVFGKRQEIDVEPYKRLSDVKGEGPYKWI